MFDLLFSFWSLLPIPIGVFCIFLAWHVFSINQNGKTGESKARDQELSEHFGKNDADALPAQRSIYFSILFLGLGIGSILIGLELFNPGFVIIGKIVFFVTITSSFLVPFIVFKCKYKTPEKETAEKN